MRDYRNAIPTDAVPAALISRGQALTFALVAGLFFAWGLAANMTDTLLSAFKRILSLTDFQTAFVQYAFFGGYFCFAIPASLMARRYGYKAGLLIGLGLYIAGALLFYPASLSLDYFPFLVALYVLAAGLSFLETCANPFIYSLGPRATATRRLNLAQSFNPVGAISGALLAKFFILDHLHQASAAERAALSTDALQSVQRVELTAVMGPYVAVAAMLSIVWVLLAVKTMPADLDRTGDGDIGEPQGFGTGLRRLARNRRYLVAIGIQFLYVGAQVGVWSFTIRYVMTRLDVSESAAATYYPVGLVLFFLSRFICTWLMGRVRAETLLFGLAVLAGALCAVAALSHGVAGVYALVAVSGCMALMFPTIYGIGLSALDPRDIKLGGAGLVMAISGGAVVVGLQGLVSDLAGDIGPAFWVPSLCFGAVALFGWDARRRAPTDEPPPPGPALH